MMSQAKHPVCPALEYAGNERAMRAVGVHAWALSPVVGVDRGPAPADSKIDTTIQPSARLPTVQLPCSKTVTNFGGLHMRRKLVRGR